jgi:hypothetical protein
MPTYSVKVSRTITYDIIIEADDEADARQKVMNLPEYDEGAMTSDGADILDAEPWPNDASAA